MGQVSSNYIGGEWVEAANKGGFSSINPATGEEIGQFSASTQTDAEAAVEAAGRAFSGWAASSPASRAAVLYRAADLIDQRAPELARLITTEEGKTLTESTTEVKRSAASLRYYATEAYNITGRTYPSDEPGSFVSTLREPLGVITAVTPWNFPLSIPTRKIAPALAAGNTVVYKPSSLTPATGKALVEILVAAGLPKGVLNFVTGPGGEVGQVLATNRQVRAISFTGSNPVGASLQQAAGPGCRIQLEMGGKNPLVIMEDADLDQAAQIAVKGAFGLAGQACTGTSRVIVIETVLPAFLAKLRTRTEQLKLGNGLDRGIEMGPLASQKQFETVLKYVQIGQQEGAKLVSGGEPFDKGELASGYFVTPAIFSEVAPAMKIAQEEIFGPVLAVLSVHDFEEALEVANSTRFGLSASICTRNLSYAHRFAQRVQAGMVKVNKPTTGVSLNAPFGGVKDSSSETFKEQGREAIEFYTRLKTIDMAV